MWHKITHRFRWDLWENVNHLAAPGYIGLYQQRCRVCGVTRVIDTRP